MTDDDDRPVAGALSRMVERAPAHLMDRIAAQWAYVEGPVEDVYVAFTPVGISSVVPASTVSGAEVFAAEFSRRFGRPLFRAARPPAGVEQALRSGRATGLRFDLHDLTPFEQAVLAATLQIPPGELRPYAWVAGQIDRPRAVRAVGTALGNNPIPVLIPCHRVIRSDGNVGQYGFGQEMKRRLLDGEGVDVDLVEAMVRGGAHFVGDASTRVVCMPTCHRIRPTADGDRQVFASLDGARRSGFRPCADCRPVGR